MMKASDAKKIGLFLGGVLFGTAGIKILSSKDAKKAYVQCTAAALRAKDSVMKTVTTVQENAGDVLAEAKQINEDRAAEEAEAEVRAVNDDIVEIIFDPLHLIFQNVFLVLYADQFDLRCGKIYIGRDQAKIIINVGTNTLFNRTFIQH